MPKSRSIFLACVPLILACGALPFRLPFSSATPEFSDRTPGATLTESPTPTASPLAVDPIIPVPLHVGYGVQGDWFEVYFTDPSNPASLQASGGVDARLVQAIDSARLSVHAAMYSLTLNDVRDALTRAHRRGVDVRLVTESDNLDGEDLQRLMEHGLQLLGDRREGSMHNKFMVIDGYQVWTGSMNYTVSGAYLDNNTLLRITSESLAANYEEEFAEMFEDDRFGPDPGRSTPNPQVHVGQSLIESYFAPDDGVESVLVDLIDSATTSIDFLAFSLTSNALGDAIRRADHAGLDVRGVMDEEQAISNAGTELTAFWTAGIDVRLDGNPGQMHEKVILIDGEVVIVGSYNFSRNANETNDENVLVIHNRLIARQFLQEFERLYALARP